MDEVLFSAAAEACIRVGQLDQLSALMKQLEEQGVRLALTAPCYGSMIKAYGTAGDVDQVWQLWREMGERGVWPTSITVGCTVDALVKNGRAEDAWALVQELSSDEEKRQYVNTVIFSTVLKGFAAARQPKRIFAVHAEMSKAGVQCNTITYNTIIDACARCSCMDRVPAVLEEMKQGQVEPDVITYSTLVKGYCLAGDVDRAFKVLAGMKAEGKFSPDEILYNSLLDGCATQNRKINKALALHETMITEAGCAPDEKFYSVLARGCLQVGSPEKAATVIRCAHHLTGTAMPLSR